MRKVKWLISLILVLALISALMTAALASDEPEAPEPEQTTEDASPAPEAPEPAELERTEAAPEETPAAAGADTRIRSTGSILTGCVEDNDELFAAYAERAFYGGDDSPALDGASIETWTNLTGAERAVYPALRQMIAEVAAGERTSTIFYIPYSDVLDQTRWTAEELGVSLLERDGFITDEASFAIDMLTACDVGWLITAMLADCPYELYWFDKTVEYSVEWDEPYIDAGHICVDGGYTFYLPVAFEYADGDAYLVDPAYGTAVRTAAENARDIVAMAADGSDYEKLYSYLYEICGLNSYNYDAVEDDSTPYGNPWQLIWVFDGDPNTNVVCEGYSKAFQYLCDMTDFDADICCYSVWGDYDYGDGGGAHMWNIVRMDDGRNYLVDVTNCDQEEDGVDESLFLKGCDCGSVFIGYTFYDMYGGCNFYTYDYSETDNILYAYTLGDLVLSAVDYGAGGFDIAGGVAISSANFPDNAFRDYLIYWFDWEEDGYLSPAELKDINYIDIEDQDIHSLKGIAYFPYLRYLFCSSCGLTELDVTQNPLLETLSCMDNRLAALDLRRNALLLYLDCSYNRLAELDISENPQLEALYCEGNVLTQLDIGQCQSLITCLRYDETWADGGVVFYGYEDWYTGTMMIDISYDESVTLTAEIPPIPGDVDGDGIADAYDAALLLRYIAGLTGSEDHITVAAADINKDGAIDPSDAVTILMPKG